VPDDIRLAASGASGIYLGTVLLPEIDWGQDVIQRHYVETANTYGGVFAYQNAPLRRISMPFIFQGTSVDHAHNFISQTQAQIIPGGGAVLDVQFENASWMTRFDVVGGLVKPDRDVRYARQSIVRGTIELEAIPFGYSPTWMIAASKSGFTFQSGVGITASVIGDVAAPAMFIFGASQSIASVAGDGASGWYAPMGAWITHYADGTWPQVFATAVGRTFSAVGSSASFNSFGGGLNAAGSMWGVSQDQQAMNYGNVGYNQPAPYDQAYRDMGMAMFQLSAFLGAAGTTRTEISCRALIPWYNNHPSAGSFNIGLVRSSDNLPIGKRTSIYRKVPVLTYTSRPTATFQLGDFGTVNIPIVWTPSGYHVSLTLDSYNVSPYQASTAASIGIPSQATWAYIFDSLILLPVDSALYVVPTVMVDGVHIYAGNLATNGVAGITQSRVASGWCGYAVNPTWAGDLNAPAGAITNPLITNSSYIGRINVLPFIQGAAPFVTPNASGKTHHYHYLPVANYSAANWYRPQSPSYFEIFSTPLSPLFFSIQYQPRWLFVR
jgi:hypothetical protein